MEELEQKGCKPEQGLQDFFLHGFLSLIKYSVSATSYKNAEGRCCAGRQEGMNIYIYT